MSEDGQVLGIDQVVNDPVELAVVMAKAWPDPEVALEATYGRYWAADRLETNGARVHLVHPLGQHRVTRRVKNDVRDSTELAKRLRRGDLPRPTSRQPNKRAARTRSGCFTSWAWPGEARTYGGGATVAEHRRTITRLVTSCRAGLDLMALRGEALDGLRR